MPAAYQHRVLFWGILGALVMRALLIAFAGVLIHSLHLVIYLFGAFLIFTGYQVPAREGRHVPDLENNRWSVLARRFFPVTPRHTRGSASS